MNALQSFLATLPCGFLTDATLPELIKLDRLHPCLVRCGGGRFVCAADQVDHFIKALRARVSIEELDLIMTAEF